MAMIMLPFVSCKNDSELNIKYLAVKLDKDDKWGIVKVTDGEMVLEDEFKEAPSLINEDGIFYIRNKKGLYDFYNIKDPDKALNETSYVDCSTFIFDDVAPVVAKDECISLIDDDFDEIVKLDKSIVTCSFFKEGRAIISDKDEKHGIIDKKGKIIVKPQYSFIREYSDGIAIAGERKKDDSGDIFYYALDDKGEVKFKLNSTKYSDVGDFVNGYLPVVKGNKLIYLNKKGDEEMTVCEVPEGSYHDVVWRCSFDGKYAIYFDGEDSYGLKNKDGEKVLRAKYDILMSVGDGKFIACRDKKYGLIDNEGKILIPFEYSNMFKLRENVLLAWEDNEEIMLLNEKGDKIGKKSFVDVSLFFNSVVKSNYFDADAAAADIAEDFTASAFGDMDANTSPVKFSDEIEDNMYNYNYSKSISLYEPKMHEVFFDDYLTKYYPNYDGYTSDLRLNRDARITAVTCSYGSLDNYSEHAESKLDKALTKLLEGKGYKMESDGYLRSPSGNFVGLNYTDGDIVLYYIYGDKVSRPTLNKNLRSSDYSEAVYEEVKPEFDKGYDYMEQDSAVAYSEEYYAPAAEAVYEEPEYVEPASYSGY